MTLDASFKEIVDMLAELKDTSELMMDLAYSSIFLYSKDNKKQPSEGNNR